MNHNEQQLLNTVYNDSRQLRADVDDTKARLDKLVEQMNAFVTEARPLLEGVVRDTANIEARLKRHGVSDAPTTALEEIIKENHIGN